MCRVAGAVTTDAGTRGVLIDAFPSVAVLSAELPHVPVMTHDGSPCQPAMIGNEDGLHPRWEQIFKEVKEVEKKG